MNRYELTDFEWSVIEPLLPNKPRGVPRVDDRRVLNGIMWVLRSGAVVLRIRSWRLFHDNPAVVVSYMTHCADIIVVGQRGSGFAVTVCGLAGMDGVIVASGVLVSPWRRASGWDADGPAAFRSGSDWPCGVMAAVAGLFSRSRQGVVDRILRSAMRVR